MDQILSVVQFFFPFVRLHGYLCDNFNSLFMLYNNYLEVLKSATSVSTCSATAVS